MYVCMGVCGYVLVSEGTCGTQRSEISVELDL